MLKTELVKVQSEATISLTIKRSVFIAYAVPIANLAELEQKLAEIRTRQPDAKHHVYAWQFYDTLNEQQYAKFSDDGEPSQTAGAPLFHVLTEAGINNTLLVVSRIFGGILLGAGGLVRAYSKAGNLALQEASYERLKKKKKVTFSLDYALYDQFCYYANKQKWQIFSNEFAAKVTLVLILKPEEISALEVYLDELNGSKQQIKKLGTELVTIPYTPNLKGEDG